MGSLAASLPLAAGRDKARFRRSSMRRRAKKARVALCVAAAVVGLFLALGAAPVFAAGNLTIDKNTTITANADYNDITGSGSRDLTVTGARVTANDIRCATVHMLARNAIITSTQNFRMGP
ncbi:MAG: hypothetical protein K2G99_04350, partial [Desulfovibrio sp.]|nr:hypothetical protein [Desulfovibrio sp.]